MPGILSGRDVLSKRARSAPEGVRDEGEGLVGVHPDHAHLLGEVGSRRLDPPTRGIGRQRDEGAGTATRLDDPRRLELPIRARHRARGDAELLGERAHRRQARAGRERTVSHRIDDLRAELLERGDGEGGVDGRDRNVSTRTAHSQRAGRVGPPARPRIVGS